MNISININDLVEQISNLTSKSSELASENKLLKQKILELETRVVDFEVQKLKDQIDLDKELDGMFNEICVDEKAA